MKKYPIHDNYSRPWLVNIDGSHASIYKQDYDESADKYIPQLSKPIYETAVQAVMPGKKSKTNKQLWQPSFVGNTILLQLSEKQYIYVGGEIYRFDVITGDKITAFFSDVGNNDVPYPYAVGEKYIYILMEYAVAIEKSWFNMKESIYDQYYLPDRVRNCKHGQAVEEKFNNLKKYTRKLKKKLIKKRKF
jgi:hypothetical protein